MPPATKVCVAQRGMVMVDHVMVDHRDVPPGGRYIVRPGGKPLTPAPARASDATRNDN